MTDDMSPFMMPPPQGRNYFQASLENVDGLKYRLDGNDIIKSFVNSLRGISVDARGNKVYNPADRMMNERGVNRIALLLQTVNKSTHLTKYENEERVLLQVKEIARSFRKELTKSMKIWAPETYHVDINHRVIKKILHDGREVDVSEIELLSKKSFDKVRNPSMIVQQVENILYASMNRGARGFEAELVSKIQTINENRIVGGEDDKPRTGIISRLFGR